MSEKDDWESLLEWLETPKDVHPKYVASEWKNGV